MITTQGTESLDSQKIEECKNLWKEKKNLKGEERKQGMLVVSMKTASFEKEVVVHFVW
jgi:hypothetical protein